MNWFAGLKITISQMKQALFVELYIPLDTDSGLEPQDSLLHTLDLMLLCFYCFS